MTEEVRANPILAEELARTFGLTFAQPDAALWVLDYARQSVAEKIGKGRRLIIFQPKQKETAP